MPLHTKMSKSHKICENDLTQPWAGMLQGKAEVKCYHQTLKDFYVTTELSTFHRGPRKTDP